MADHAVQRLVYQPLGENEIRLVRISTGTTEDQDFDVALQHFDLASAAPYFGLSYVWGDPSELEPLLISGSELGITTNLHSALVHINMVRDTLRDGVACTLAVRYPHLFLWVDALCINQADVQERSRQILRMGTMFSSAFTTLIWLGTAEETLSGDDVCGVKMSLLSEVDLRALQKALHGMSSSDTSCDLFKVPSYPVDLTSFEVQGLLAAHIKLMRRPWHERSWVTQEICLSQRDALALVGRVVYNMRALFGFGHRCSTTNAHITSGAHQLGSIRLWDCWAAMNATMGWSYMPSYISSTHFRALPVAQQLLLIIRRNNRKEASVPYDKIYSALGLIDATSLPSALTPDYQQSFEQVCRQYTRYLLSHTQDLQLLVAESLQHQPSWVVDFAKPFKGILYPGPFIPDPLNPHTGHFTDDGLGLVVHGARTGRVVAVMPGPADHNPDALQRLQTFYDTILSARATMSGKPLEEVWHSWVAAQLLETRSTWQEAPTAAMQASTVEELIDSFEGDIPRWLIRIMKNGQVLLNDDVCLPIHVLLDDFEANNEAYPHSELEVWGFKGAHETFLLRKVDGELGHYRMAGCSRDINIDAGYFAKRTVESIVIV